VDETSSRAEPHSPGHEERDVQLRPLIISGVSLALLAGMSLLAMWLLFDYFAVRRARFEVPPPLLQAPQLPPEPRLQVSPTHDWREMLAAEMATLHSYGWVDRQAGIVRIPIDRAIEILAERGLPHDRGAGHEHQHGGAAPAGKRSRPEGGGR
jgi:hypothetical protein